MTCNWFLFCETQRTSEQLHNFLISSSQETHRGNITVVCDDGLVGAPWTVQHGETKVTKPFCTWLDQKRWRLVCRWRDLYEWIEGWPFLPIGKLNHSIMGRGKFRWMKLVLLALRWGDVKVKGPKTEPGHPELGSLLTNPDFMECFEVFFFTLLIWKNVGNILRIIYTMF